MTIFQYLVNLLIFSKKAFPLHYLRKCLIGNTLQYQSSIAFSGFLSVCLTIHPVLIYITLTQEHTGNFITFGTNVHFDSEMNDRNFKCQGHWDLTKQVFGHNSRIHLSVMAWHAIQSSTQLSDSTMMEWWHFLSVMTQGNCRPQWKCWGLMVLSGIDILVHNLKCDPSILFISSAQRWSKFRSTYSCLETDWKFTGLCCSSVECQLWWANVSWVTWLKAVNTAKLLFGHTQMTVNMFWTVQLALFLIS